MYVESSSSCETAHPTHRLRLTTNARSIYGVKILHRDMLKTLRQSNCRPRLKRGIVFLQQERATTEEFTPVANGYRGEVSKES